MTKETAYVKLTRTYMRDVELGFKVNSIYKVLSTTNQGSVELSCPKPTSGTKTYVMVPEQFTYVDAPERVTVTHFNKYLGARVECVISRYPDDFYVGKIYEIVEDEYEDLGITDETGYIYTNAVFTEGWFKFVEGYEPDEQKQTNEQKRTTSPTNIKITDAYGSDACHGVRNGDVYKIHNIDNDGDVVIIAPDDSEVTMLRGQWKATDEAEYTHVRRKQQEEPDGFTKVEQALQVKIDKLTSDAEHLFTKRDRLNDHAIKLNAKARHLEELRDELRKIK